MVVLDTTAVNVALPTIRHQLAFSSTGLAWVVNAYLISFGGMLLLAGRIGDLVSRRMVFLVGLGIFTLASLACGIAGSQQMLIAARFVQGVGGAMLTAVILGMIVGMFPEPQPRARAIAIYSFVLNVGGAVGLVAGGLLTQSLGWQAVFFINIPVGVAALILASRWLEAEPIASKDRRTDYPGAGLITAALMLGVYTLIGSAASSGWGTRSIGLAALSIALMAVFLAREATTSTPLIPLSIFRSIDVTVANVIQALLTAGMFGVFFIGALYLKRILAYDALQIGLAFLPMTVTVATVSLRYADRLIGRHGAARTLLPGLVLVTLGLLLFQRTPLHGRFLVDLLPAMVLLGGGVGLAFPAVMTLAMSQASETDAGLASGLINTTIQVAGAIGLAVLATVAASDTHRLQSGGEAPASALNAGYHLAFLICAALVLVASLINIGLLRWRSTPAAGGAGEHAPSR